MTDTQSVWDRACVLKLYGLLDHWYEICDEPWLPLLIGWEEEARRRRSLERRLKRARLGRFKPIADFDWAWPKKIDREQVDDLFRLDARGVQVLLVAEREADRGSEPPEAPAQVKRE